METLTGLSFQMYLYQPSTKSIELCGVQVVSYTPPISGGDFYEDIPEQFEFVIVCPDESIRDVCRTCDPCVEYLDIVSEMTYFRFLSF